MCIRDRAEEHFISLNRYESLSPSLLDDLDDKGYIFPIKYAGRENGIYISKDRTLSLIHIYTEIFNGGLECGDVAYIPRFELRFIGFATLFTEIGRAHV